MNRGSLSMKPAGHNWQLFGASSIVANLAVWSVLRQMFRWQPTWLMQIPGSVFVCLFFFALLSPVLASWKVSRYYLFLLPSPIAAFGCLYSFGH